MEEDIDIDEVFGPMSSGEQIKDILSIFEVNDWNMYRPVIGKIINKYGYDIAVHTFDIISQLPYELNNVWAYAMAIAKDREFSLNENRDGKELINNMLSGKISIADLEELETTDDIKDILKK